MSSNLLKRQNTNLQETQTRVIDTNQLIAARIEALSVKMCEPENEGFREGIRAQEVDVEALLADTEDSSDNVLKASAMEELTASANEAAQAILDAASREAEEMRNTAVLQAQEEADRIREQAREQGYRDGADQAKREYEAKLGELENQRIQMEREYQELLDNLEPQMVEHLSAIYEHLFHVELGDYKKILLYLISDTMHKAENGRNFIIRVSAADYEAVSAQREQLMKDAVYSNSTVEIIEDVLLKENECMIETEGGIYDCGLDTRLSLLRKRLRLLSFQK